MQAEKLARIGIEGLIWQCLYPSNTKMLKDLITLPDC